MKTLKLLPLNQHWYPSPKKKDVWYPSVTMVTGFLPKGQFFERYLAEQESWEDSQALLKEAGDRGTRVHDASEILDNGGTITYGAPLVTSEGKVFQLTDEEYQLLSFYINWHKKFTPKIVHVELRMVSDKMKLGGKLDRIYEIDDKTVLFDLKTSKSAIFDSHWIQVACYSKMYEELYKTRVDEVAILRLTSRRKEGYEYVTRSREEWLKDYQQFKKTYDTMMYLGNNKVISPKIIEVPEVLSL